MNAVRPLLVLVSISAALFSANCGDDGAQGGTVGNCPDLDVPSTVSRLGSLADAAYSARVTDSGSRHDIGDVHQVWQFAANASVVLYGSGVDGGTAVEPVFNVALAVEDPLTSQFSWAKSNDASESPTTIARFLLAFDPGRGVTVLGGLRDNNGCQVVIIDRDEARDELRSRLVPNSGRWPL
jgi:hypothetical protein